MILMKVEKNAQKNLKDSLRRMKKLCYTYGMMKLLLALLSLSYTLTSVSSNNSPEKILLEESLRKLPLSSRCRELFKQQSHQKNLHQKLSSLKLRTENILKKNPTPQIKKIQTKTKSTQVKIRNELYLSQLKIDAMKEKIIRSGCPEAPFLQRTLE